MSKIKISEGFFIQYFLDLAFLYLIIYFRHYPASMHYNVYLVYWE